MGQQLTYQEITDNLFQSLETLNNQKTQQISFDKTIVCKVLNKNDNTYSVSNDSISFEAKSLDDKALYPTGSQVYVLIPNGDYSQEKIIIGKYISDTGSNVLRNNSFNNFTINRTEKFNNLTLILQPDQNENIADNIYEIKSIPKQRPFDYIGIEFGIDTMALRNQEPSDYSYQISFVFTDQQENTFENSNIIITDKDILGNPMAMFKGLNNQFLFKMNFDATLLKKIRILFNCTYNGKSSLDNPIELKLSNIQVHFGYDTSNLPTNKLELLLADKNTKDTYERATKEPARKDVNLTWYYQKDETSSTIAYPWSDSDEKSEIKNMILQDGIIWLKYKPGSQENTTGIPGTLHWQVAEEGVDIELNNHDIFSPTLLITSFLPEEKYKAYINYEKDGKKLYIESNELVFSAMDKDEYNLVSGNPLNTSGYSGVIIGNNGVEKLQGIGGDTNSYLDNSGVYSYVNGKLSIQIDNSRSKIGGWNVEGDIIYSNEQTTYGSGFGNTLEETIKWETGFMGGTDYITNPYFYIGYNPSKEEELSKNSSDGWVSGCNYKYPTYPKNWISNGVVKTMISLEGTIESSGSFYLGRYQEEGTNKDIALLSYNANGDKNIYYKGSELFTANRIIVSENKPTNTNDNPYKVREGTIWVQPII